MADLSSIAVADCTNILQFINSPPHSPIAGQHWLAVSHVIIGGVFVHEWPILVDLMCGFAVKFRNV